jgi:hypothetical protein
MKDLPHDVPLVSDVEDRRDFGLLARLMDEGWIYNRPPRAMDEIVTDAVQRLHPYDWNFAIPPRVNPLGEQAGLSDLERIRNDMVRSLLHPSKR